jgi:hypothetical protein
MDLSAWFSQAISAISGASGQGALAYVSVALTLIISLTKVSSLNAYWQKLGAAQAFVAPVLSVIIAVIAVHPFSWSALWASLSAGLLSIAIHELLDALKSAPFIGAPLQAAIGFIENLLQKPKDPPAAA